MLWRIRCTCSPVLPCASAGRWLCFAQAKVLIPTNNLHMTIFPPFFVQIAINLSFLCSNEYWPGATEGSCCACLPPSLLSWCTVEWAFQLLSLFIHDCVFGSTCTINQDVITCNNSFTYRTNAGAMRAKQQERLFPHIQPLLALTGLQIIMAINRQVFLF